MNTILIIVACVCAIVGLLGSIIPGLPGPPLSWVGLLLLGMTTTADYSVWFLLGTGIVAAIITVLDYVIPSVGTKKMGGSKAGVWGCNIGLVVSLIGLPFGPQGLLGVIFWPFIGAFIGELTTKKPADASLKAACGAFFGFMAGTLIKLVYCLMVTVILVKDLIV